MAFIGDIFHGIANLFSPQQSTQAPAPVIQMPKQPTPQQQPAAKPTNTAASGSPSFLAAAALPNYGTGGNPNPVASNPGGKSLLGQ